MTALYGATHRRVSVLDIAAAKEQGEKWAMLTAYDHLTAGIFESAGVPVLLVGDSAANNVLGYENTIGITVDEMLPMVRAVVRGTQRAMVIADLPFGSYESSPTQALETATRFFKESGAHAVKLEGGTRVIPQIETLVTHGIPVVGHLGLTPQSVHALGGYRVQGRGGQGEEMIREAKSLEAAGAFAVVLEMIPSDLAQRITSSLSIPTIGIGAGKACDAQVLVWQDLLGMHAQPPRLAKKYVDLRSIMSEAVSHWVSDVSTGAFPTKEQTFN